MISSRVESRHQHESIPICERSMTSSNHLTHTDAAGKATMVDVRNKPVTDRFAVAEGRVTISAELAGHLRGNTLAKGDALTLARIAGIQAAKRTDELIPLCHSIPISHIDVNVTLEDESVHIRAEVSAHSCTGVEMEALTAVAAAALCIYDMGKSIDRSMRIERIRLIEKRGGRSGTYTADAQDQSR